MHRRHNEEARFVKIANLEWDVRAIEDALKRSGIAVKNRIKNIGFYYRTPEQQEIMRMLVVVDSMKRWIIEDAMSAPIKEFDEKTRALWTQ